MKKNYFVALAVIILISFSFLFSSCKNGQNIDKNDELIDVIDPKDDSTIKLNLSLDENEVLSWDEVEGASSYEIIINDKVITTIVNEADLFYEIVDSCEYKININVLYDDVNKEKDISETLKYQVPIFTGFDIGFTASGDIKITNLTTNDIKGKIIIPSRLGDEKVVSIDFRCFEDCDELTGIIVGSNIEEIGYEAFKDCDNLKFVNINSVKKLKSGVFENCVNLEKVLYDSLEEMNGNFFKNTSLDELYISNSIKTIKALDVFGKGNISNIEIATDNEYFYIENNCLMTKDKTLVRPYGNFSIPKDTKALGVRAFYGMDIEKIEIPYGVEKIGSMCFCECKYLSQVCIPDSVTEINDYVFENCIALKEVVFPIELMKVKSSIFEGCINLESIDIGSSDLFDVADNCLIDNNGNVILGCKTSIIPANKSIISIMENSFVNVGLERLVIPANIEKIGRGSFSQNEYMKNVVFNEGLVIIDYYAFEECYSLGKVIIPKSVKMMNGFHNCMCEVFCFKDTEVNSYSNLNCGANIFIEEKCSATGENSIRVKEFGYENEEYYVKSIIKSKTNSINSIIPTRKGYRFLGWSSSESKEDIVSLLSEVEVVILSSTGLNVIRYSINHNCEIVSFKSNIDFSVGDRYYAIWQKEE